MVEIRRDTYLIEPGGPLTDGSHRLVTALADLVDAVSAHAPFPKAHSARPGADR